MQYEHFFAITLLKTLTFFLQKQNERFYQDRKTIERQPPGELNTSRTRENAGDSYETESHILVKQKEESLLFDVFVSVSENVFILLRY